MSTIRVIIITVPPAHVRDEIEPLRKRLCRLAGDGQALAYPPHITLRTGAFVPQGQLRVFADNLGEAIAGLTPFPVRTDGIYLGQTRHQGEKRHICAATFEPCPSLLELNRLLLTCRDYIKGEQRSFWPHLSLVYGSLSPRGLVSLENTLDHRPDLLRPNWHWVVDHVALYALKSGTWAPLHTIALS
jgi:2'-5' RNA ligase